MVTGSLRKESHQFLVFFFEKRGRKKKLNSVIMNLAKTNSYKS